MTGGYVYTGVCLLNFRVGTPIQLTGGGVPPSRVQVLIGVPPSFPIGGGTPILPDGGTPILPNRVPSSFLMGGTGWGVPPSQVQVGGTPLPKWGWVPLPRSGCGGGVPPSQVWRVPLPRSEQRVPPCLNMGRGYPPGPGKGVSHLPGHGKGYPPPPPPEPGKGVQPIQYPHQLDGLPPFPCPNPDLGPGWGGGVYPHPEQHSVYLLRGGRYASCVHAGELSCLCIIFSCQ